MAMRLLITFGVVGLVLVGAGCRSAHGVGGWSEADLLPARDGAGQVRPVAFASDQQRQTQREAEAEGLGVGLGWLAVRKDAQLAVEHGVQGQTVERTRSVTVDRQRVIRGRVRDASFERTYRVRVREGVR